MKNVYVTHNHPYLDMIKIKAGDVVVLKPNLVKECNSKKPDEWECVITSSQLIREVCEYVCNQLKTTGKVYICDAPQTDSSFEKVAALVNLYGIASDCHAKYGTDIEVVDMRDEEWTNVEEVIVERRKLPGDPNGTCRFNLGKYSFFYGHKGEGNYYGADYDYKSLNSHHKGEIQEYLICGTPIKGDVFISLPKMKTHKKTGVTLSLKNLVGINADKNWLPHHTFGSPKMGGDEYPDTSIKRYIETWCSKLIKHVALELPIVGTKIARIARKKGKKVFGNYDTTIRSGNWYGNDTTWRMVLDLNRCFLYGNYDGSFRSNSPKRYYSIIDGVIAMEGSGPGEGDPRNCGVYIAGDNPALTDTVAATLMGFDWEKIPVIRECFKQIEMPITTSRPDEINVVSDVEEWNGSLKHLQESHHFDFAPHFGWKGHIELNNYIEK